ncbi:muramoyltetrapeptide carboxypeptidase [Cupriavidus sp. AU9028]|uniref:muramoyltetrapeptide carboxypeptidase n=1 Tax=Cupriavidus sp. AU9028 TaxID=2871157 RepID=UPI001C959FED|nr:muramoyltetrapeptide carboxypeptidase [Cupriavidus sp. AU9028]MBY4897960.1 muramoyltetrapeptide carboxypeptidase [Cupriavidus sp. AU9028]
MSAHTQVRLIACSGYAPDADTVNRGLAWLDSHGYGVDNPDILRRRHLRFGGTDDQRLADLHAIGTDQACARTITLAVRGGYGASRLLGRIDFERIAGQARASRTPIVGHSDFTAFQLAYLARAGGISFAGPMLLADFGAPQVDDFMWRHFEGVLRHEEYPIAVEAPQPAGVPFSGDLQGTLWGGNLAMICSLLGTPYFPRIEGGILFVEDVNEPPYRVERLLLQLEQAGVLAQQKALLLGDLSAYRVTDYDNGYDMDTVVGYLQQRLQIPVLTGLPFGHCARKLTLPVGGQCTLRCTQHGYDLRLSGHPVLASA